MAVRRVGGGRREGEGTGWVRGEGGEGNGGEWSGGRGREGREDRRIREGGKGEGVERRG